MSRIEQPHESLVLPSARDAGLLAVALAGVSASGPIMAATAAPALAIAFWRNALGAGSTGLVVGLRHRAEFAALDRRGWALASVAGVFLALHFGTWVPSVKLTSVASATALVATQSVFTGLIAAAAGRRLPRLAWLGMALAIVGTALIAGADFAVSARALAGTGWRCWAGSSRRPTSRPARARAGGCPRRPTPPSATASARSACWQPAWPAVSRSVAIRAGRGC